MHVTDPHLFADSEASLRGTVTRSSLQSVLQNIQAAPWSAHLISVTGDVIQDEIAIVRGREIVRYPRYDD